jgi:hypothetical protein
VLQQVQHAVEKSRLSTELALLDREMYALSWAQYEQVAGATTPAEQRIAATALRNAAYFAVPLALLDPAFTAPEAISTVVQAELALIAAGESITVSPLMAIPGLPEQEQLRIDYARFVPRGAYAQDAALVAFHQAQTWHRAISFRPSLREETRSATLIAWTLSQSPVARVLWQRVHAATVFFGGRDASFTPAQYADLLPLIWPGGMDITALADEEGLDAMDGAIAELPLPSNPVWTWMLMTEGLPERTWRFLPETFRGDSYVFSRTTGPDVGSSEEPRDLPSFVDLAAALGSLEALQIADEVGASVHANYVDQIGTTRNQLSSLTPAHWSADTPWNWLYVYGVLVQERTETYPQWMRTVAWKRKDLQAVFGAWTGVRHDAEGLSGDASPPDRSREGIASAPWGYVEPQPTVYARLAGVTRLTLEGLDARMMLSGDERALLLSLEEWLRFLEDTARRELTGQALSAAEYARLGEVAALLPALTAGGDVGSSIAIAAAQGVSGTLVTAVGPVDVLYVIVERDGQQYLARGGTYSHYEFVSPTEVVWTDALWRALLDTGDAPLRPTWTDGFVLPGVPVR